jgi:hypothetical protein
VERTSSPPDGGIDLELVRGGDDAASRLRDLAGSNARGAGVNALRCTTDHGTNLLDIWIPTTVGADVGVTQALAERGLLAAKIAN